MKKLLLILFFLFPAHSLWAALNYNILINDLEKINTVTKNHLNIVANGFECYQQLVSTGKILKNKCSYFLNNFLHSADKTIENQNIFNAKYRKIIKGEEFKMLLKSLRIDQQERLRYLLTEVSLDNEVCVKIAYKQYALYEKLKKLI